MALWAQKSTIIIPPLQNYDFEFIDINKHIPEPNQYTIVLKVKSQTPLEVQLINKKSEQADGGFGLAAKGKTKLSLSKERGLKVKNPNRIQAEIVLNYFNTNPKKPEAQLRQQKQFVLSNTSDTSIPLLIPGVMNPNLSPHSESNVLLSIGQEIFYRKGIKQHLILVVDDALLEGSTIDVTALIRRIKN